MHGCCLPYSPAFAFSHLIAEVEIQMLKETSTWQKKKKTCLLLWKTHNTTAKWKIPQRIQIFSWYSYIFSQSILHGTISPLTKSNHIIPSKLRSCLFLTVPFLNPSLFLLVHYPTLFKKEESYLKRKKAAKQFCMPPAKLTTISSAAFC